jgi:nicotinic acid mononucleotide adenylyltransferase
VCLKTTAILCETNIYENRLYFGTFNIHVGHLIANHMAENSDLDQVWLVVTHITLSRKKNLA